MTTSVITRGNVVAFATSFLNEDDESVSPATVTLTVDYVNSSGGRTQADVEMEFEGSPPAWRAVWDSAVARAGRVYWEVQAEDPAAADQGYFDLDANRANQG